MQNVLVTTHWMIGFDWHAVTPSCFVTASLHWAMRSSFSERVTSAGDSTMHRGTDIMNGIPHIPAAIVSPLAWGAAAAATAFSGSKSHFGVARVLVDGGDSPKPVAVAVLGGLSLNLNCGDVPTPSGIVNAPNTVVAQMTWADLWGGLLSMAFDLGAQAAINRIFDGISPDNSWRTGLFSAIIGTPLGFSCGGDGDGPVGFSGRVLGAWSNYARSIGEDLGGDAQVARETHAEAVGALRQEPLLTLPFHALNAVHDRLSDFMSPPSTDAAFDNPGAEQFP